MHVNLSKNNLSHLELAPGAENTFWLPSLHTLELQSNKLSMQDSASGFFLCTPHLHTLQLQENLVSDSEIVMSDLEPLNQIKVLDLSQNLLSKEQEVAAITNGSKCGVSVLFNAMGSESQQDKFTATVSDMLGISVSKLLDSSSSDDTTLITAVQQVNSMLELINFEHKNAKKLRGWKNLKTNSGEPHFYPPDLISMHCDSLKGYFELSITQRFVQCNACITT